MSEMSALTVFGRARRRMLAAAGPLLIFAIGFGMGFTLAAAWATAP
ncbi:hypothetical protein ACX6XY_07765 [Streptomyces sp. O3]